MFIRVKSAKRRDPQHKFDVSVEVVERHPERYKVVDAEPVRVARPVEYVGRESEPVEIAPTDLPLSTADVPVE